MTTLLLLCLLNIDDTLTLGIGQPWYDKEPTKAASEEYILDYQPGTGRIGLVPGYAPFQAVRKDASTGKTYQYPIHAPGYDVQLALNVGQRVLIEGKIVNRTDVTPPREELWIGKMQVLGIAPLNAFSEIKPIARTKNFQPNNIQVGTDVGKLVMRSGKDVAKALNMGSSEPDSERLATMHLTSLFSIKTIDWKTQMVVYVGSLYQRNLRTSKIEITKLDVTEKGLTVYWRLEEGTGRQMAPVFNDTVLIPKVEGDVIFKQEETKKSTDKPDPLNEKIAPVIPGAPIK